MAGSALGGGPGNARRSPAAYVTEATRFTWADYERESDRVAQALSIVSDVLSIAQPSSVPGRSTSKTFSRLLTMQ